ncbi:aldehyde dehydrogenase family protein [Burkholderia pseudomallei]|uniref:aldehyde dehydrogenase family protein n=1 Tax=Burkholderia pseudomallei TaxID=28450 RepID=UPI000A1A2AE7|nr:aldehyde dehydrogenase family protein [Burkholderia pseudomallei]ARM00663.1 aldehyde dehydrogenase [Burkholderia pseudomallei]MBM5581318.1 aldehyde dehydrogenase family protein [Burkholderia pseudomallei]MBM5587964.1 aldehyde dehydrogenase family protein [Burkholderia pseudomallei]RPA08473.1 aldehyde dehydrogenase family protein [Burkholderia pseudomallei]
MNLAALSTQHQRQSGFLARRQFGNWIDGRAAEPRSGRYLPVVDPATEMTIAEVAASDARDVDAAVAAARRAFDSGDWPRMRPASREKLLHQLAERLERYADELAALETLETGKLIGVARAIDVLGGAEYVRYMAGWATKLEGSTLDTSIAAPAGAEYFAYTRREAVGVVGAIVPWNFPLAIALWKVATALACGCTVVLKPSEETPLTALRLGELAQEAGLPDGVLNIVTGAGAEAGAALAAHPGIDKITFTGSVGVGRAIGHAAVERMARFTLELGGKSPLIVLDDADPDFAAHGAAQGIFFNQGQVCTAGSRVYVQKRLFEQVVAGIAAAAEAMKIGSGFDPNTQIGPLVSKRHFERVLGHVDAAKEEGATLVTGGTRALDGGYFVKPTVFVDAAPAMRIVREEVFGPVVTVTPFDTVDDAVRLANDTDFGLAASVWSQNLSHVHRVVPRLKAGIVWVNTHNMLDPNLPFGGFKQSGYGRELGRAALEQFTELKSVCIAH